MGGRAVVRGVGALVAASSAFVATTSVASAAFADDERAVTFTFEGQEVTCRLFGQSDVIDDTGSASSGTNGDDDGRCAAHVFVEVTHLDAGGARRSSSSATFSGTDVSVSVDGVEDSFTATHTARFLNCEDQAGGPSCQLSFQTTPK